MAEVTQELQVQDTEKQEVTSMSEAERTRDKKVYIPRADIYETNEDIYIVADMPGVDENSVEILLEKNVLTINGYVEPNIPENYSLSYAEYEVGDYQRSFTLSNLIDQDNIEATVKNGVLRLRLPKAGPAKARKITVKAA
ncbi:MAG: Hsp20/alpha crystallin family protein [Chloroflexi bacterium]|nr:MAG: Hsp20/alpha crystallin family protein [Chloroflexota bacterium]